MPMHCNQDCDYNHVWHGIIRYGMLTSKLSICSCRSDTTLRQHQAQPQLVTPTWLLRELQSVGVSDAA